ncbi:Protein of unknown function [Bacillus toyonensis]|nr:Protein of unknown function [Bacillus mycoides]SCN18672.1 Protein of unknown function [Bacillus toyonensis]
MKERQSWHNDIAID